MQNSDSQRIIIASGFASVFSTLLCNPFEVLKIRLQSSNILCDAHVPQKKIRYIHQVALDGPRMVNSQNLFTTIKKLLWLQSLQNNRTNNPFVKIYQKCQCLGTQNLLQAIGQIYRAEGLATFFNGWRYAIMQSGASNISIALNLLLFKEMQYFRVFIGHYQKIQNLELLKLTDVLNLMSGVITAEKLTYEQQLQFLENLEQSNIKQPQKVLYDEYTGIAIQFGYTTMFAPAFPAAPLFFMINCFINLKLSISNYQNILKRERAQAADSIGIWLSIFSIMNYSATFMNCIVIGTVDREQISNLIGSNDSLSIAFTLVAVEHFLLFIKYILDLSIPDCPKWVETELKRYEFLEKKHAQSIHSIRDKETKSEKKIEE